MSGLPNSKKVHLDIWSLELKGISEITQPDLLSQLAYALSPTGKHVAITS